MKLPMHAACLPFLSAALLLTAGCGDTATPSSTVIILPDDGDPPGPLLEIEPNDDSWNADYIGEIHAGDYVAIEGHVTECCPDPFDGFAFYATQPVEVVITLTELDHGTDLDFGVYDPYVDEVIAAWETDAHPETGVFYYDGVGEFHIVVASYLGDSSYVLEIEVFELDPLLLLTTGTGPNGPEPDGLSHERFRGYHSAPLSGAQPDHLRLEAGERAELAPLGIPTSDLTPLR